MIITHDIPWDKCLSHQVFPAIKKGWKDRKEKIHEFNPDISLPDTLDFQHIKDKRGFSVKDYIQYEYNTAIMYPGKYYHCSQNVENFTSKKSLAIFTNETLYS